uniref:Uncharacterized protein n=1 Tax=Ditylenchus dipsaci TaxID=166011 RepID=A0A915EET2_9BILA
MEYFTQWNPLYDGDETEDDFNFNFINEDYNLWAEFEDELSESTAESSSSSKPRHNYFGSEDSFSDQDPVDEIISEDIATENIVEEPVISGSQNNGSIFKEEEEEIPIMIDYYQNTSSLEGHSRNNTEEIVMTESSSSSLIVKRNLLHATSGKITEFEQDILQPYKRTVKADSNKRPLQNEATRLGNCLEVNGRRVEQEHGDNCFIALLFDNLNKAKVKECIKCLLENFTRKKLPRRNTHPLQKKVCQSSFVNSDKDVQENGRALGTAGAVPLFSESTKEKNLFVEKSTEGSLCYNIHTLTDEGYSFEQITEWLEVYMDVPEHTVSKTLAFDVQQGFQLSWDVQNVQLLMKLLPTNFVTMDQLYVVLGILVYEHGIVKTSDTDAA